MAKSIVLFRKPGWRLVVQFCSRNRPSRSVRLPLFSSLPTVPFIRTARPPEAQSTPTPMLLGLCLRPASVNAFDPRRP